MPPPAISARIESLQFLSMDGVRRRERRPPSATVAGNYPDGKLPGCPSAASLVQDLDLAVYQHAAVG
jgi:hypothetical protein